MQEAKRELKKPKSLYKILGVKSDANDDEIKKAYRKRALLHHPDRHSSESEEVQKEHETKFKEVSFSVLVAQWRIKSKCSLKVGNAYEILMDPVKRRNYDIESGAAESDAAPAASEDGGGHGFHYVDPNSNFQGAWRQWYGQWYYYGQSFNGGAQSAGQ